MAIIIQQLIDEKLKTSDEKKRIRSGKFSPSSTGYCYRKQVFNRQDVPKTNPPDARILRVFACGNLFHDFVQGFFPDAQTEVPVETDDLYGRADIVLPDEVVDIKSVHSYQFHYFRNKGYDINKEKFCNILQLMTYAYLLKKSKGRLVFVSKDDLCIEEVVFFTEKWKEEVEKEITHLQKCWKWYESNKEIPMAQPRAFISEKDEFKECRSYCAWRDHCVSLGHTVPELVKKEKKAKKEEEE